MATYLPGSNVQADAMHTLYLMNPTYAGYTEATNSGNMLLIGPSAGIGQSNPLSNNGSQHQHQHQHQHQRHHHHHQQQQQQHYIGLPLPALAQHAPMTAISGSTIGHQNPSSTLYGGNVYNNNWNGGNEFSFVPSSDGTQSLAAHLTSVVNPGQQPTSELPQYSLRGQSASSLNEQHAPLLHSGLNMENTKTSSGPFQGLSLSLCPQQPIIQMQPIHTQSAELGMSAFSPLPHAAGNGTTDRSERLPNKWMGSLSSFKASSRDGIFGAGYQNSLTGQTKQLQLDSNSVIGDGSGIFLHNSKYLKAAQQLLDEVVSFERGMKGSPIKHAKLQSWAGHNTFAHGPFAKDSILPDTSCSGGAATTLTGPSTDFLPRQSNENVSELTPVERQELQTKKAKLMAMLDEVERRYNMYYSQMQIVVTSFESAAGIGSAKTYTALALQTISRHFRSVKDAISGQIRVTSKALGEEDPLSQSRGEASRLQFVDQQLQQQRALQQLGMMQQNAWRPQRGLPERSVSVLRAWLFEHFLHPYPKDSDKMMLAKQTGLTRNQVSNWFINARVRLWKPMVEEMYLEETREAEAGATEKRLRDETENAKGADVIVNSGTSDYHKVKQVNGEKDEAQQGENSLDHASEMLQTRNDPANMLGSSDSHLFYPNDTRRGLKKPRNEVHDSVSILSANMSMEIKSEETQSDGGCQQEKSLGKLDQRSGGNYILPHNGIGQPEMLTGFGSYHNIGGLSSRYDHDGISTRYPANNGVSLTLGLQRYDGLTLSGQHHYMHGNVLQTTGKRQDSNEAPREDCYNISDNLAHQTNYEIISFQDRKGFATQLLHHDFVV